MPSVALGKLAGELMTGRFVPSFSLDSADEQCGDYTRAELEEMDAAFVAAVEAAFQAGLESRAAASATVRFKSLSGREAKIESAIEAAWDLLSSKRGDMTALEVLSFVRARVPGVALERVRFGFELRFRERGVGS